MSMAAICGYASGTMLCTTRDVQVVCDAADTEQMYKTSPCVVVEVLSPSTQSIDLREKLLAYRLIDSLRAYVIVYRDEMRVLRHYRDENGTWWDADVSGAGRVPFPCPVVELTLADIYRIAVLPTPLTRWGLPVRLRHASGGPRA